jgi:dCMP deaminase
MKQKFIEAYMKVAETFAELSHAKRLHVGAIVVKDNRIISIGYNGTPAGWDNTCEYWFEDGDYGSGWKTKPEVLHAERNALDKLAKGNEGGLGSTMFITHAPCLECAKSIYGAGILHVYYRDSYRSDDGIQFLTKCGVNVEKLSIEGT